MGVQEIVSGVLKAKGTACRWEAPIPHTLPSGRYKLDVKVLALNDAIDAHDNEGATCKLKKDLVLQGTVVELVRSMKFYIPQQVRCMAVTTARVVHPLVVGRPLVHISQDV